MGLWYHFCDTLPSQAACRAYLKRQPPAPENWNDILIRVLHPERTDDIDKANFRSLREEGFTKSDAAYINWLKAGEDRATPFLGETAPAQAAQYRTRSFSFWSRAFHHQPTRSEHSIPEMPESWRDAIPDSPSFDQGWNCLADGFLRGSVLTPWEIGMEPEEPNFSATDGAGYLDAFARWVSCSFDDKSHLQSYLKAHQAPPDWQQWAYRCAPID